MARDPIGGAATSPLRPGHRLAALVRRFAWVAATGSVVLLGSGFSWALGRAGQAPPSPPLPPAEARLVQQQNQLSKQITAEQQQLAQLTQRVQQLTGGEDSQGSYGQLPAPRAHSFTGAS